ncbi:integrase, partial [Salmonella enterica subsp. enterica serovar Typhimurium]|nr:integrase [Salmonella enterica subsp. enterica serovar Typhimurium]
MLPHPVRVAQHQHAKQGFPIRFHYDYLG